ncbi:MAG TPA: spore germination protein GerW family protein [Chthonomonadaceae bacterium]|nr:spore germination protein GerW family protein [Chthonomonadaceae bacterium]
MTLMTSLAEYLQRSAHVTTVYGQPIHAEGKTIIPAARIAYGFGGGYGTGKGQEKAEAGEGQTQPENAPGSGGGGGGGVVAVPVGVVEITPERTQFIAFGERRQMVGMLIAGVLLGLWIGRKRAKG